MSNQQQFTPKTVYDHQVLVDVMEGRKKQDNVKTGGSKCNRCAYDIEWNFDVQHVCDKDNEEHYVVRSGYVIKEGKAACIIAGQQSTILSPSSETKNT